MTPTNAAGKDTGKPKPKFNKTEYGLAILVLVCAYFASLTAVVILAGTVEGKLAGAAATTVVYTFVGILVTSIYQPVYR